jgi:hypothetical protein
MPLPALKLLLLLLVVSAKTYVPLMAVMFVMPAISIRATHLAMASPSRPIPLLLQLHPFLLFLQHWRFQAALLRVQHLLP